MADVFVSYSHKDLKWKERLLVQLSVLQKEHLLDVWDDGRIDAGGDWYSEIQQALASAKVAILLVSANFLSSDFVLKEEVPQLLERRHKEGLGVIPVVITPCVWQRVEWLKKMQVELFKGKAMSAGSPHQIDEHLADLAAKVIDYLGRKCPAVQVGAAPSVDLRDRPGSRRSLRIVIVDNHDLVRHGLSQVIRMEEDMEVVGLAKDGDLAVELARELLPDVVLMDTNMPNLNGIEATREIQRQAPGVKVLVYSMSSSKGDVTAMSRAGASGYVLKDCELDELVRAVRAVAEGGAYLSPSVRKLAAEDLPQAKKQDDQSAFSALTVREREVLQLIAEGITTRQIALRLCLSPKTVEVNRLRVMNKLDIDNIAQLTKYAIREGLTPPAP